MLKALFFILSIVFIGHIEAKDKLKYQTFFGTCPSVSTGKLTLKIIQRFEKTHSLNEIKKMMVTDKLDKKYFLSHYKVDYNPVTNFLKLHFKCPEPLMKVQVYKENGVENYEAILVKDGELFDPTFEVLLRAEKKLKHRLPFFALPIGELNSGLRKKMAQLMMAFSQQFRILMAEVIYTDQKSLTIIFSIRGHSISTFLGKEKWLEKLKKLQSILLFMKKKHRYPVTINITNIEKPVAKFAK